MVQTNSQTIAFVKRFHLSDLFKSSCFFKEKGVKLIDLFVFLMNLVFQQKNLYEFLRGLGNNVQFKKDTGYGFLNNPRFDWRRLLLGFGSAIVKFLKTLTSEKRVCALVIDDSSYYRNRSKKVELLSCVRDHACNCYFKGFRKLTAGWTDGSTFVPLAFALLSSSKPENRLYEQGPDVPDNSPGMLRRKEAICKGTDVVLALLDQTLEFVQEFQYVLFDSWFSWPKVIKGIKDREREVICMLKNMPTLFYTYQGKSYTLSNLYAKVAKLKKNPGYIASVVVDYYGITVRVVFGTCC